METRPLRILLGYLVVQLLRSALVQSLPVQLSYTSGAGPTPDKIGLTLTFGNISVDLQLRRHRYTTTSDPPLYTASVDETGKFVYKQERGVHVQNVGMYQDESTEAVFQMSNDPDTGVKRVFRGQFRLNDEKYLVTFERRHNRDKMSPDGDYNLQVLTGQVHHGDDYVTFPEGLQYKNLEPLPDKDEGRRRRRRDVTTPNYFIDIVAVVDFKAYSRFLSNAENNRTLALTELVQYYVFIISGVDLLYQGTNSKDFSIHVVLNKIIVAQSTSSSPYTEQQKVDNTVDIDQCLDAFKNYTISDKFNEKYDHVMLFTGYELTRQKLVNETMNVTFSTNVTEVTNIRDVRTSVDGDAYVGTMCRTDGTSTSVVSDLGGYQSYHTAARLLGHSLSALYDGDNNTCSPTAGRYIMEPHLANATERLAAPWRFSNCSARYMKSYIDELMRSSSSASCLTDRLPVSPGLPVVSQSLPGLNLSINDQCRLIFGTRSSACQFAPSLNLVYEPWSVCSTMFCYDQLDNYCHDVSEALSGTICGSGKICLNGECVADSRGPVIEDEYCLFGDNLPFKMNGLSCSDAVAAQPAICYNLFERDRCCASCRSIYRHNHGCEYGDHLTGCTAGHCTDHLLDCCGTCNYTVPLTSPGLLTTTSSPPSSNSSTNNTSSSTTSSSPPLPALLLTILPASTSATSTAVLIVLSLLTFSALRCI